MKVKVYPEKDGKIDLDARPVEGILTGWTEKDIPVEYSEWKYKEGNYKEGHVDERSVIKEAHKLKMGEVFITEEVEQIPHYRIRKHP